MTEMTIDAMIKQVLGCAFKVHNTLKSGFLEKVYEKSLKIELERAGLKVVAQAPIHVWYEGVEVGEFYVDLLVEDQLIVELKAVQQLTVDHEVQLVNYLTATQMSTGLLLNFGSHSVEYRRKYRDYRPSK